METVNLSTKDLIQLIGELNVKIYILNNVIEAQKLEIDRSHQELAKLQETKKESQEK